MSNGVIALIVVVVIGLLVLMCILVGLQSTPVLDWMVP